MNDRDQIRSGWEGSELPAIRCLDALLIDGALHNFNADGGRTGRIVSFTDRNHT